MTVYVKDKNGVVTKKTATPPLIEQEDFCSKVIETPEAALKPKIAPSKSKKDNS